MGKSCYTNFIGFLRDQADGVVPAFIKQRVNQLAIAIEKGFKELLPALAEDKIKLVEQKIFPKDKLYFFKRIIQSNLLSAELMTIISK
jgi:hypothetical protein